MSLQAEIQDGASPIIVEYLVIGNAKKHIAASLESLRHVLQTHDKVSLKNKKLNFDGTEFKCSFSEGNVAGGGDPFYHLSFTCRDRKKIELFARAMKAVRMAVSASLGAPPQTLWDGIGSHYANLAYPQIHHIENLMRKLITKFMVTNVGSRWTHSAVPKEIVKTARTTGRGKDDFLYGTDFIHLADFLFNRYANRAANELVEEISRRADEGQSFHANDLLPFVPTTNWDRYFGKIVECDGAYLQKRWKRLYELRCMIAHNSGLTRADYDEVEKVVGELTRVLVDAISKLATVEVSEAERETVAEEVAGMNMYVGQFLSLWKALQQAMHELALSTSSYYRSLPGKHRGLMHTMRALDAIRASGTVDDATCQRINKLRYVRNEVVHSHSMTFGEAELQQLSQEAAKLVVELRLQLQKSEALKSFNSSESDGGHRTIESENQTSERPAG